MSSEESTIIPTPITAATEDSFIHTMMTRPVNTATHEERPLQGIYREMEWYIRVVGCPVIGTLGFVGNILSAMVIARSGLHKPSNIFLLALAVADCCALLGAVNIPLILTYLSKTTPPGELVWDLPERESYMCFIGYLCFEYLGINLGSKVSGCICGIIAVERIIAVYFPLRFHVMITPRRAWLIIIFPWLFWIPFHVYFASLFEFVYVYIPPVNDSWGGAIFNASGNDLYVVLYVITPLGNYVPVTIVSVGSILVGVKIVITRRRRRNMAGKSLKPYSTSRTTRTLLAVCVFFSITRLSNLSKFVLNDFYSEEDDVPKMFSILTILISSVNSSFNFFVYVAFNPKFRALLKEMLVPRKGCGSVIRKAP